MSEPTIDIDTAETVEVASVRTDMSLAPYRLTIGLKAKVSRKIHPDPGALAALDLCIILEMGLQR